MEKFKKQFLVILPPQGDYTLRDLQTKLFSEGVLENLGPEPFLPWEKGTILNRSGIQSLLPLSGTQWVFTQGMLGIGLQGRAWVSGVEDFPGNMIILGYAQGLPGFCCPDFKWNTVRVQTWEWSMERINLKVKNLEVMISDEMRIGRGLKKDKP